MPEEDRQLLPQAYAAHTRQESRAEGGGIAAGSFAGYWLAALLAHRLVRRGQARTALWAAAAALAGTGAALVAGAWSLASLA